MKFDPADAPARPDLTFLRHRARPKASTGNNTGDNTADSTAGSTAGANPVGDFLSGRGTRPNRAQQSQPQQSQSPPGGAPISFHRPDRRSAAAASAGGSLDLSAPSAPRAPASAPSGGSLDLSGSPGSAPARSGGPISFDRPGRGGSTTSPLDLGTDPEPPRSTSTTNSSLDLSSGTTPATPAPARAAPAARPTTRPLNGDRVSAGRQHLMSVRDPTVVLTRVQSGIGELTIEAAVSAEVGDLRLGAAYQLRSGPTSIVQLAAGGNRYAPSSRRPVIVAGRDGEFEELGLDLRQVRDLERMAVYAFSESRTELTWSGTLVVTTSGGVRVELPLEALYAGVVAVLMSIYNLDGELVIRAEMETIVGDVREAARAYGYDRITWRDGRNPVE